MLFAPAAAVILAASTFTAAADRVPARAAAPAAQPVSVAIDAARVLNSFRPDQALGAGLDGHGQGDTRQIYTPANIAAMRSAGLQPLSYRLRTELGVEAWHWSPLGHFSAGRQGYWTSQSPRSAATMLAPTYGYRLPRRGDTVDQANDDSFSRLDDGSPATFWKSNPYLDPYFNGGEAHPQWVLIDLHHARGVNALRIDWGTPYAVSFQVQYWIGPSAVVLNNHPPGHWAPFGLAARRGRGGVQTLRLQRTPRRVRFVRVLMTRSSDTAPKGSHDVRDRLGYAIRELGLGTLRNGRLSDLVRHRPDTNQTITYVSSTDPWHTRANRDTGVEQPSFQRLLRSGLTSGQPVLVPVPVLYGTPAEAVAELRYLQRLGIPIRGVELGEEPDGQLASPEDYGALYLQFARAIHRAFPSLVLGGPGYQTSIPDWQAWPDVHGDRSYTHRFIEYLRRHRALDQLGFFSLEWYPFDNTCAAAGPQLASAPRALADIVRAQLADGLPPAIPRVITEYGYSAFAGQAEVELPGALLDADVVGQWLASGGSAAYLYGLEPDGLQSELTGCKSFGNLTLLLSDSARHIRAPLPTYWATRMLTQDWTQPGGGHHLMLASSVSGSALLSAYTLRRPDGSLAVLLLNRDPLHAVSVTLPALHGPLNLVGYGPDQYSWRAAGAAGHPLLDLPPARSTLAAGSPVRLAPLGLAVVTASG
ncbi:MAG: hypothetical protein NVSMB51_14410 [Solirubrobacteraceae bacterium]